MADESTHAPTPRAGVIGLGMIGRGIAASLANSSRPAAGVYDIRPEATEGLANPVESPAALAAESDVLLVSVNTGDQVYEALTGTDGVLVGAQPGLIVVLLSTVELNTVRELAELCRKRDITLLDAGVTGGTTAADNALVTMIGGPEEAVRTAMPVLNAFSRNVIHCGELGAGMVTKLSRNVITYGMWATVREATSLAAAGGVDPAKLLEVMRTSDEDITPTLHLELLAQGIELSKEQVSWASGLADKDLNAAQELAAEVGVEAPIADLARPRMSSVYAGQLDTPLPENNRERGRVMMDRTYGPGYNEFVTDSNADEVPSVSATIDYLFPQVWARPYLPLRDRRLLTLGMTTMLGRADLLETQLRGAVHNGELTIAQLRELAAHLHHYAGWGNGTNLLFVTEKLIAEMTQQNAGTA